MCSRVVICRDCAVTTTGIGADDEGVKVVGSVGVNVAVSEWVPGVSVGVNRAAVPPNTGTGAPSAVVPSVNSTVPTAVGGVTVARRMIGNAGFGDPVSVVVVATAPVPALTT